ncbi:DUF3426 domain-containing protein [Luteimonas sp. 3794]|uniref:DUF3426 domain-containing protein n=1 Tax=Luteimonas sp. 3794 TaxID=2817730 RepID=UPI00285E7E74|nr:DUF3426 domain-containing protein [Luteimonas sp. 3794]MDR6991771.1 hypothetical protein [Luteimonas sp. 3794]
MFINCKHCGSLVATDPATDQPPERCPRCRGVLRSAAPAVSVAALLKTTSTVDAAASGSVTPSGSDAVTRGAPESEVPTPAPPLPPEPTASPSPSQPAAATFRPADPPAGIQSIDTSAATATVSADPPAAAPGIAEAGAAKPAPARASPSFARRGPSGALDARMRRQQRILACAVLALCLLLGLQVLLADRARLAADPGWRPTLARLCAVLRCGLPPWREPSALTVLARDVRPDAARPGALLATTTFRNDARWAQAWPRLRLTLSDIDGRIVGARVFTPQEYLASAPPQPTLDAGASVEARLQLVEPDARAVSFAFDFL